MTQHLPVIAAVIAIALMLGLGPFIISAIRGKGNKPDKV